MRPSGHLHSTVIALALLYHFIPSFSLLEGALFLAGAVLLDGDFIVSKKFFHMGNHRMFLTHSMPFFVILILISLFTHFILLWLFLGALYHLSFDIFDWGIPIVPFQADTFFTPHILQVPPRSDEKYFFQAYFGNNIIKLLEIVLLVGFIGSIFFLPVDIFVVVVGLEGLVISEFIVNYRNLTNHYNAY